MSADRFSYRRWLATALMLVLAGCARTPSTTRLANAGGIGGTGISSGMGGTGISGVGGTGISAFGRIQRFGSVFVNGREYPLNRTRITVDGRAATARDLHLGDVVALQARLDPATGRLQTLRLRGNHALLGKVDAVNPGDKRLTVLGQTVRIQASTRIRDARGTPLALAQLKRGDTVAVSGLARAGGAWAATRLTRLYPAGRAPSSAAFVLSGRITRIDPRREVILVGNRRIDVAHAARPARLHVGQEVRVQGRYRGARLQATGLRLARPLIGKPGSRVDMEGYVQVRPGRDELISNGVLLRYGRSTTFSGGSAHNLTPDRLLVVSGTLKPDGSVAVNHVTLGHEIALPALHRRGLGGEEHGAGREGREHNQMENPSIERPEVEHPDISKPEIERPHIEKPDMGGMGD